MYTSGSQTFKFLGLPLTLTVYKRNQMELLGFIWSHLYTVSYRLVWVNLDPHKGTQIVHRIHFENH